MTRHPYAAQIEALEPAARVGYVRKITQDHVEAIGPLASVGDICEIAAADAGRSGVLAEVVAIDEGRTILTPFSRLDAITPNARVVALPSKGLAPVGEGFAGRAVTAFGAPIDGRAPIIAEDMKPLDGNVLTPLERGDYDTILETGLRAIDGLLPIGRGQRIGVFSASGVGKTTLIRQIAAHTACDRGVLCLVGERGREVESHWREASESSMRQRVTCVAATSDLSAPLRVRAVRQALCLAEHWRDQGLHVLFVLDSVTRFAMALREVGLAAGAPPTVRAYTPNVFAALPRIVERCGAAKSGGSITAVMTVLAETDDVDDPIVETMKALLDGHIVLSRTLSEQGRFPAIDIARSVSRQSERLMKGGHASMARRAVSLIAAFEESRLMIEGGLYKTGSSVLVDEAIRLRETLLAFLRQPASERASLAETLTALGAALSGGRSHG